MEPPVRRSTRYNINEIHAMLDEVPTDNESSTDGDTDSDLDPEFDPTGDGHTVQDGSSVTDSDSEDEEAGRPRVAQGKGVPKQKTYSSGEMLRAIDSFLRDHPVYTPADLQQLKSSLPGTSVAKLKSVIEVMRRRWKRREITRRGHDFILPQGPKQDEFAHCVTPGDVFLKFLDEEIVENIVYQSNLYITEKMRNVQHITREELYGFLGVNLVMGYHQLPSYVDFWRNDPDLGVPFVSSVLPRNRFSQILSNLHVNSNSQMPVDNTDKLYKIRPLIESMNGNFIKLYNVSHKVSIDESMILFKGRHSIKQYNPMKPIKRGYKLWVRADMDGYISKFDVYQGKKSALVPADVGDDASGVYSFGLGERIVQDMTNDLFGKHHEVYFDNYFSSLPLLEFLKTHDVDACGTIRANRKGLPDDLEKDKSLTRGDFDFRVSNKDILYVKWMDNKAVHLVSNFHGTEVASVNRTQKDGSKIEFPCPVAIRDYNQSMGGVDKADMLCAIHGLDRKSKKWWHRIFFGIIDRVLVNAQITYKNLGRGDLSTFEFRRSVAQTLVTISRQPRVGRPPLASPPQGPKKRRRSEFSVPASIRLENLGAHWVTFDTKRGRCEVCPFSKCSTCNVFLCVNRKKNCFSIFHDID